MLNWIIPEFWVRYAQAILGLLNGDSKKWIFHSEAIFPIAAKCTYKVYGPSGTIQSFDAFCLLPLNVMNKKIFIIVSIWYVIQVVLSISNLLYWMLISYSIKVRIYILYEKVVKSVTHKDILYASHNAHLGHFFILRQIARNTNPQTFIELLTALSIQNVNEI